MKDNISEWFYKEEEKQERKRKYTKFCQDNFVPVYSKPWWMDAICEAQNWDVWLYEHDGKVSAAMPFYFERRGKFFYITKAPLTQNNGILFSYPEGAKEIARQKFEEEVINEACRFIEHSGVDVYEQQYRTEFKNWLPFFWNHYTATIRYTQIIKDVGDLELAWEKMSTKKRGKINKGLRNAAFAETTDYIRFYKEHEKIFLKQGLQCPFSFDLWDRLVQACMEHKAGCMNFGEDGNGNITCLSFLVWDERTMYHLLGGNIPEFQNLDTYSALTWKGIQLAHEKGLQFDFEGSVIKRIHKANQEYGAVPIPYYRIRKVFSQEVLEEEFQKQLEEMNKER